MGRYPCWLDVIVTLIADDELGGVNAWIKPSINQKWVAREVKG